MKLSFNALKGGLAIKKDLFKVNLSDKAPKYGVWFGIASMAVGGVLLAVQTTKVEDILVAHKKSIDEHEAYYKANPTNDPNLTPENLEKDKKIITSRTCIKMAKLYAVPVCMMIGGAATIVWGTNELSTKVTNLTTALAATNEFWKGYQNRVKETIGEEAENDIFLNKKTTTEEVIDKETGEKKTVTKKTVDMSDLKNNPYLYEFHEFKHDGRRNYVFDTHSNLYNFTTLTKVEARLQERLDERTEAYGYGWVWLDEMYRELGDTCPVAFRTVGWCCMKDVDGSVTGKPGAHYSPLGGDAHINLRIRELRELIDGYDLENDGDPDLSTVRSIFICPNVDGDIQEWLYKMDSKKFF